MTSITMSKVSNLNRNWSFQVFINLFIFAATLQLANSSKQYYNVVQNPGKKVNFYGEIQNIPSSQEESAQKAFDDLVHPHCPKSSGYSSCIKDLTYHYPGIDCQVENPVECDPSYPYRTFDGTCNNLRITRLGEVNSCFERFMPAYYEDGGEFRKSVKGGDLPTPRDITLEIFKDVKHSDPNATLQFTLFGEKLVIDTLLAKRPFKYDCCSEENSKKPECRSVYYRADDPFYSQFNQTCMTFHRTEKCPCSTPQRAQKNVVTAALDFSNLYGPSEKKAKSLRKMDGTGRLNFTDSSVGCLLPSGKAPDDLFCPKGEDAICFRGGDARTNHHSFATSHLTIFMREHNRIATELKKINPKWEEEKLFQEARKINIAEYQAIIYQEFLPLLLSPRIMDEFGLTVHPGSNGIRYDPKILLGMWNEFGAATYRLHGMVPTDVGSLGLRFRDIYSNPGLLREGYLSTIINGSHFVPSEQFDRYMTKDVSDYLYKQPEVPYGGDLSSLNIQRGRDHGLPPYIKLLTFCSNGAIIVNSFDDLYNLGLMTMANVELLKQVYKSVEDIDMWVGIQLEHHFPESVTGPSAVCINAKQFYFLQRGDRFFFNIEGPDAPFTPNQRSSLKQTSFSRWLCDNTDINKVMKNPFVLPSEKNFPVSCDEIPRTDLNLWKED